MSGVNGVPSGLWINLGSGPARCDGWISVDGSWQASLGGHPRIAAIAARLTGRRIDWPSEIVRRDLRKKLPFENATGAVVYSSHTLEHLHRDEEIGRASCRERV